MLHFNTSIERYNAKL